MSFATRFHKRQATLANTAKAQGVIDARSTQIGDWASSLFRPFTGMTFRADLRSMIDRISVVHVGAEQVLDKRRSMTKAFLHDPA